MQRATSLGGALEGIGLNCRISESYPPMAYAPQWRNAGARELAQVQGGVNRGGVSPKRQQVDSAGSWPNSQHLAMFSRSRKFAGFSYSPLLWRHFTAQNKSNFQHLWAYEFVVRRCFHRFAAPLDWHSSRQDFETLT